MQQLDLFSTQELQSLNENFNKAKDSSDKVRRGIFARLDAHKKEMEQKIKDQSSEIENIKLMLREMGLMERVG